MRLAKTAWGKFDEKDRTYHHLVNHMADVTSCFLALAELPVWKDRLDEAAQTRLSAQQIERLSVLVFLHDIGKLAPGFQCKVWDGIGHDLRRCYGTVGHPQAGAELFFAGERLQDIHKGLDTVALAQWGEGAFSLLCASFSHHGRPINTQRLRNAADIKADWQPLGSYDPEPHARLIGERMKSWFPLAFKSGGRELPVVPAFQHLFAGLISLADWIGSDRAFFPFVEKVDPDYFANAKDCAAKALFAIGLDTNKQRQLNKIAVSFKKLTGFEIPNPQQMAIGEISTDHQLVILEAETGSGKTEAALWRFIKLYEAAKVDGLYFAVPTRTAAVQLHRRMHEALKRVFGDQAPDTVLAVPGYYVAGDHKGHPLPEWKVLWDDDGRATNEKLARRWAAEHSKRYLAAQVAVGTIDQAMLGALPVKHAHLRFSAMARSLLVIDEVHASDIYMAKIQQKLVQDHMKTGGHVLAMSATLGSHVRAKWLEPEATRPVYEEACRTGYPAIWTKGSAEPVLPVPEPENKADKAVSMSILPSMEAQEVAQKALSAARDGARLLVVRNTVDEAVKTFVAIEEMLGEDERHLLFSVGGQSTLHHSRFAAEDRKLLDSRVERLFGKADASGKGCRPDHGLILVGTQTLEQSLDICADYLITDLCPVDVLLQRIGRLHRHENDRPQGFEKPKCLVLVPKKGLKSCLGKMVNGLGGWLSHDGCLSGIYLDVAGLELTRQLIEKYPIWSIPAMNRELVEGGTHPDRTQELVDGLGEEWQTYHQKLASGEMADAMFASMLALDREADFTELKFPDDEKIRTRLGDEGFTVVFEEPIDGPFGQLVTKIVLPAHWSRGIDADGEPDVCKRSMGVLEITMDARKFIYDRNGLSVDK